MWAVIQAIAHVIDWQFLLGLLFGLVVALRYVAMVIRPIIREFEADKSE